MNVPDDKQVFEDGWDGKTWSEETMSSERQPWQNQVADQLEALRLVAADGNERTAKAIREVGTELRILNGHLGRLSAHLTTPDFDALVKEGEEG